MKRPASAGGGSGDGQPAWPPPCDRRHRGSGSAPPTPARAPDRQQGSTRRRPRRPPIVGEQIGVGDQLGGFDTSEDQPACRGSNGGDVGQLSEGVAPPRCQLGGEQRPARQSGIRPHPAQCPFELHGVDSTSSSSGRRAYPSCAAASRSPTRATQPLETWERSVLRALGGGSSPHGICQGRYRDHFVEACQQRGKHQALGPAADRQLGAVRRHAVDRARRTPCQNVMASCAAQPPGNGAATTPQATSSTITGMETMLSIWAHPDDETFLAAGIMAAAVDRGDRVVCVSATAGELGLPDPEA